MWMKPLNGLRILEFDGLGPVTFAGMMLADMGAEVLRLTRDASAGASPFDQVGGEVLHRGRRSVPVNLKSDDDRERIHALAASADAVIEGFRPGVMERLGYGPQDLQAQNPALVYGRVTGWGQDGPLAKEVGHDLNYIGLSGVLHAIGAPDRAPPPPLNLIGDYGAGAMFLVSGVLAALIAAKTTGKGDVVDAAMVDGTALMGGLFQALGAQGLWSAQRGGNLLDGGAPFYRCYACQDGAYVAVAALEPRFYASLITGLDLKDFANAQYDPSTWPQQHSVFAETFQTRDRDDWIEHFSGSEACVTPVLTFDEARLHPHAAARMIYSGVSPNPAPRFGGLASKAAPHLPPVDLSGALKAWTSS